MTETAETTSASRSRGRTRRRRRAGPLPTLRILETRVLRGPNYWAREPVVRLLVDLGVARGLPVEQDPGLRRRPGRADAHRSRTTPARWAGAAASSPG